MEELKSARLAAGMSKYELAQRSGISRTMIYHLEKGDRNPSLVTAHALATELELDFSEIAKRASSSEES